MKKGHYPSFYQIQEEQFKRINQDANAFWLVLLKSTGIFFLMTFIVFGIVNYKYLLAQFKDLKNSIRGVDYEMYFKDSDNDGMTDFWEEENRLDINKDDSLLDMDKDKVDNITEFILGTNPNEIDSDKDGWSDGEEIDNHYYPNGLGRSDVDQDGVYDWWEKKFNLSDLNAKDAKKDLDNDGLNNYGEFLCNTNPLDEDFDNNGILDGEESACQNKIKQINNSQEDPDQDGLTTVSEKFYGTNPDKSDSDQDGYDDFQELTRGYNPIGEGTIKGKIIIDAIDLNSAVIWSDEFEYDSLDRELKKGIVHDSSSAFPKTRGNVLLASLGFFIEKDNDALEHINEIKKGDQVILEIELGEENIKEVIYEVGYLKKVNKNDTLIKRDFEGYELTIVSKVGENDMDKVYLVKAYLKE